MSNVQLNYTNDPITHARAKRVMNGQQDTTETKYGIPLPTRILISVLKPVDCPICQNRSHRNV